MRRPSPETEERKQDERDILWLFDLGLILKAINGAIEVVAALVVAFIPRTLVVQLVNFVTAGELTEDRSDIVSQALRTVGHYFAVSNGFIVAAYLFLHGIIKVALVLGIFAGKRLAYPLFMLALGVFGAYEAYLGIMRNELLLGLLGAFDFVLLLLTFYEFRKRYPDQLALFAR